LAVVPIVYVATNTIFFQAIALLDLSLKLIPLAGDLVELDMEFNSLDAQREACEAYVASQRSEGWVLVPDRYDDGGISGATLERPALKRLLHDVDAGLIDVVVVQDR
jgi:Resolvase, N terminal domain